MSRRDRVATALQREVSNIIHDELKDPRIGFITITRVDLTGDLRLAKIYYSVLGNADDKKNTNLVLKSANGFIRRGLAQRLNLRFAPEIVFKEDNSCEYSIQIEEILKELREGDGPKKSNRRTKKK